MNKQQLKDRTKRFHISIIKLCEMLPRNMAAFQIAKQLIRSAGSVGANYRAACHAKSPADFVYKIKVILEEADESMYWLEILKDANLVPGNTIEDILKESKELVLIFSSTCKTARDNLLKQNLK
ncbi:four helix bundle protein [Chitinophaga solisilvae]|uniref:four helix bundle protein n=1 Tax=Chitinophaga solisilvae TaxID=1233460 RepID=UPI001367A7AA|nr:four helix bundle protein [Chitinophaga solisilvae]